jgi:hypothetical protein
MLSVGWLYLAIQNLTLPRRQTHLTSCDQSCGDLGKPAETRSPIPFGAARRAREQALLGDANASLGLDSHCVPELLDLVFR